MAKARKILRPASNVSTLPWRVFLFVHLAGTTTLICTAYCGWGWATTPHKTQPMWVWPLHHLVRFGTRARGVKFPPGFRLQVEGNPVTCGRDGALSPGGRLIESLNIGYFRAGEDTVLLLCGKSRPLSDVWWLFGINFKESYDRFVRPPGRYWARWTFW